MPTALVIQGFTRTKPVQPPQDAWDCSRDGHRFTEDDKWRYCTMCGYTEKK